MTNKTQNSNTKKTKLVALYFVALHISGTSFSMFKTSDVLPVKCHFPVSSQTRLPRLTSHNRVRLGAARENRTPI